MRDRERAEKSNLDPNVVRNLSVLDQASDEVEVSVACSRVGDFDLLYSSFHQHSKERGFLFDGHRVSKGLIPISQICREPDRDLVWSPGWPLAVRNDQGFIRTIF